MDGRLYAYICHACILFSVYLNSGTVNAEFRHYSALWYLLIYCGKIPRSATLKTVFHFKAEAEMVAQHFICFGYLALTDASSYLSGAYDLTAHEQWTYYLHVYIIFFTEPFKVNSLALCAFAECKIVSAHCTAAIEPFFQHLFHKVLR